MRSTFSGLNTVVRGIYAQQLSLDTVGHNISNANTEGYSRQRTNLSTTMPEVVYGGVGALQVGTGVAIESVTRARDIFMDRQYWQEASSLGYGETSVSTYSQIEGIFHDELPDLGIQTVLNNFWQAWKTLSTNASNDSARTAVRERGAELVEAIQHARDQLEDMVTNVNETLKTKIDQINEWSSEIYSLNKQIANIEVGGRDNANDLRDRRDLLADKLSKMMNVRVFEDSERNYVVQVSDVVLVDGGGYTPLALNNPTTSKDPDYGYEVRYAVVAGGSNQRVNFTNGEMKALQEANSTIPKKYLDDLTTMSRYLLQEFNAVHRAGYGTENATGNNFFGDPSVDYSKPLAGPITQSRATGGAMTLAGPYNGTNSASYRVRIDSVDATTHRVLTASYSTDGGTSWQTAGVDHTTTPTTLTLANGLTAQIATAADNTAGDTYDFTVQPYAKSTWLDALSINSDLYNDNGLKLIAAKTLVNNPVTQSNASGGQAAVGGKYTLATASSYQVRIETVNGSGKVQSIVYSTDGGLNWSPTPITAVDPAAEPPVFQLSNGLTISIATDADNRAYDGTVTPKIEDIYSFSVPQGNASGDNATLLGNKLKNPTASGSVLEGASLDGYYNSMIGELGVNAQNSERLTENQQTLVSQIDTWRQATAGVNIDEEMTNMIRFQKGYNAAARILTSIDEMLDKLINGTGVVGR